MSDSLIQAKKKFYTVCLSNLENIKYKIFEKYTDLDHFERINCDFGNSYRWLHAQEAADTTTIQSISFRNKETAMITFNLGYYNNKAKTTYTYYGMLIVTMKKINNTWKINNIE